MAIVQRTRQNVERLKESIPDYLCDDPGMRYPNAATFDLWSNLGIRIRSVLPVILLLWISVLVGGNLSQVSLMGADNELPFEFPADPDRWKEEDFEKRFKGSYGINSYLEPELDVDNFNVYEGVLAFLENHEGAIVFLKNSMASLNEQGVEVSASLHFLLGNFYFENDLHDLASEQFIEAIHKHPNFLRAYENLGYSFMQNNENEKALPVLLKALELGSNDSQIHGLIGFLYLEKELYLSALTAFQTAMLFNPRNNTWRFGIFQSLIKMDRHEDALGVAEEILLFDPDSPDNWQNVANLLLRLERPVECISHLEVGHQLGGASYQSRRLLGNLYFNSEAFEPATKEFLSMIDLAGDSGELEDMLEVCEGLLYIGFVEEAQTMLAGLKRKGTELGMAPEAESMDFMQALIYFEEGQFNQAQTFLLRVLDANPSHPRALVRVGHIYAQQGEFDKAGIYFELAQLYPEVSYDALYSHAQLLLGLNLTDEALSKLRQAQTLRKSDELAEIIRSIEETGRLLR